VRPFPLPHISSLLHHDEKSNYIEQIQAQLQQAAAVSQRQIIAIFKSNRDLTMTNIAVNITRPSSLPPFPPSRGAVIKHIKTNGCTYIYQNEVSKDYDMSFSDSISL